MQGLKTNNLLPEKQSTGHCTKKWIFRFGVFNWQSLWSFDQQLEISSFFSFLNILRFPELLSSVQSLSHVQLFATPWTAARQASLSITNSRSPPKPMSIESTMPSNHLILCRPLLLLPSIFPSIGVFSDESALHIRWPKYCTFSSNVSPFQWTPRTDLL